MTDVMLAFRCPKCSALHAAALVGPKPVGKCGECGETTNAEDWTIGHWREATRTTDTAEIPGDIIGPSEDAFAENSVLVDTRRAVLLAYSDVCVTKNESDGGEMCALMLKGRVNRSQDVSHVLYLTGPDGMAALVSQIVGVAKRRGGDFGDEFGKALIKRMDELPQRPTEGGA